MNVFVSRFIASLVSAGATYVATRFVFLAWITEPENLAALVALVIGFAQAVYSAAHRLLDKKFNPADAAKHPEAAAAALAVDNANL